jgi:hypothetical protein
MMDPRGLLTFDALQMSLADSYPPDGLDPALTALWHAGKGDMASAHKAIAGDTSRAAEWVRAHLHRREGNTDKAAECYQRAGKDASLEPVDKEWSQVAAGLLLPLQ